LLSRVISGCCVSWTRQTALLANCRVAITRVLYRSRHAELSWGD
jgi:hypothetical protein